MTETKTNVSIQSWPDGAPNLTMDRELGQRLQPGEVIDFDVSLFDETAKRMGASPEEIASVHVDIIDPKYRPKGNRGKYYPPDKDNPPITEVVLSDQEKMNRTLVHEFRHRLDDVEGTLRQALESKTYEQGVKETLRAKKLAVAAGLGVIGIMGGLISNKTGVAVPGIALLAYGWSKSVIAMQGYVNNPAERRAREAEKEHGQNQIITVTKR